MVLSYEVWYLNLEKKSIYIFSYNLKSSLAIKPEITSQSQDKQIMQPSSKKEIWIEIARDNHLVFGQTTPDGSGFLGPQIKRHILLVLVRFPQRRLLLLRYHRQDLRYRQPHHLTVTRETVSLVDSGKKKTPTTCSTKSPKEEKKWRHRRNQIHLRELVRLFTSDLGDAKQSELRFEILQLAKKIGLRLPPQLVHLNPRCRQQRKGESRKIWGITRVEGFEIFSKEICLFVTYPSMQIESFDFCFFALRIPSKTLKMDTGCGCEIKLSLY